MTSVSYTHLEYTDLLSGKWYANITPIEGLTLTANISANVQNSRLNQLSSAFGWKGGQGGEIDRSAGHLPGGVDQVTRPKAAAQRCEILGRKTDN